jgi:hypothetical protein
MAATPAVGHHGDRPGQGWTASPLRRARPGGRTRASRHPNVRNGSGQDPIVELVASRTKKMTTRTPMMTATTADQMAKFLAFFEAS